jgi:hypothetical protein
MVPLRILLVALVAVLVPHPAAAVDLTKVDRSIRKEPTYNKSPRYGLLVFGPNAAERVWLVLDGDTLYVDRNGNGDLTEPANKVAAKINKQVDAAEYGFAFEAGDLTLGGRVHKDLRVGVLPLKPLAEGPSASRRLDIALAVKLNPNAFAAWVSLDVESPTRKGSGIGERVTTGAGPFDCMGILQFAADRASAPVIHLDGPWQVAFNREKPTLRLGRDNEVYLGVGTPGSGPGTFAVIQYEKAIPEGVHPTMEVMYPAARPGAPPVRELYHIKERC